MKLHENQIKLLRHLARFNLLDYQSCLHLLATAETKDAVALSYAFRPLTKYGYLSKRADGCVSILTKGRALFSDIRPLISAGGGAAERERVMQISRVAMLMEENGVPCRENRVETDRPYFIPSACWRKVAPGILSTTRFAGMLLAAEDRYAVYDIGDGRMDWQVRAEGSLFYYKYGTFETKATGMILICRDDVRDKVAENIIRQTMWARRQLLSESRAERNRPTRWSRSPIKLKAQYEHVYLATPKDFRESLWLILREKQQIASQSKDSTSLYDRAYGDYERWPVRFFANPASDLLKFVYFFSAVKDQLALAQSEPKYHSELRLAICIRKKDSFLMDMYPGVKDAEGVKIFEYFDPPDTVKA